MTHKELVILSMNKLLGPNVFILADYRYNRNLWPEIKPSQRDKKTMTDRERVAKKGKQPSPRGR